MPVNVITEKLISSGYFPKELPPPFSTVLMSQKIGQMALDWAAIVAALPTKERKFHPKLSKPTRFDVARKGHARRMLSIPNPLNQYYLSDFIAENWTKIDELCSSSKISITNVNINTADGRSVVLPPLSDLSDKRTLMLTTSRAVLQTDVLSFYHSIYTHSIPWALHGKSVAKLNRNSSDPNVFGNRIDELVRSCQDGQTMGIPVGPDTSRIISEIILSAVESHLPPSIHDKIIDGYRYVDDFFLCFSSHGDAEAALAALRASVLYFDLQLNADKTSIFSALTHLEESWPNDVSENRISRSGRKQRRSIIHFFTYALGLSLNHSSESILSFAVKMSARSLIEKDNWDIYQSFLFRIGRQSPNCLDVIVKIICTYAAIGYQIDDRINKFIEIMITDHAPYNHHFEVAWTLWLARSLNIKLNDEATAMASAVENSVCGCLILLLRTRGLLSGRTLTSSWLNSLDTESLHGENWLLTYEAGIRASWRIRDASTAVGSNPYFTALKNRNVSFFDTLARNKPLDLPGIRPKLLAALKGRKSGVLPGLIFIKRSEYSNDSFYEKLGSDYSEGDIIFPWGGNFDFDDDDYDDEDILV
ncbi:RNA-directed DNA polymerase [Sphingomonas sp. ERG5]|uniref:RNA-directed DNA polymerase n=1 Tax=Sphingomonas sp. ERG5 TaxID=1381597 RepID=UPI000B15ED1C|nr:RNA-directed DNA polymerase [Sphingomonas sp. ERG5]